MRLQRLKFLAASTSICLASSMLPVSAGIPVIDSSNLAQNVLSAMEAVAQTAKQIEQFQTQLLQYENMLQNSLAPAAYIWDRAQANMDSLIAAQDTLSSYEAQLGSLDNYLSKFQDVSYYRSSPCFSGGGCSDAERAAMEQNRRLASESQKKVNDALFKTLEQQQQNLANDARQLERLQGQAQGAVGQLQAIGYANQLASQQTAQLLQIRSLLVAQQNAAAARMQAQADLEARQQAAHATATESRIGKTASPKNWLELIR